MGNVRSRLRRRPQEVAIVPDDELVRPVSFWPETWLLLATITKLKLLPALNPLEEVGFPPLFEILVTNLQTFFQSGSMSKCNTFLLI